MDTLMNSGKFVGANITEGIVDHFRHYHMEQECDNFDLLSPAMLSKLRI